jgi:hypothetical protein
MLSAPDLEHQMRCQSRMTRADAMSAQLLRFNSANPLTLSSIYGHRFPHQASPPNLARQ